MSNNHPPQPFGPSINRIADVMAHADRYSFHGVGRLASDSRVSSASISRLVHGLQNPSFAMVARITGALEAAFGFHIDPRDLVAEDGLFLHRFACEVVGCKGCYPNNAYDEFGDLKPVFAAVKQGSWVTSRHPRGYVNPKGGR